MRLLGERDFDSVTVEMITEAADVGKGTFFNYFASKEAVVGYRFERDVEAFAALVAEYKAGRLILEVPDVPLPLNAGRFWKEMTAMRHHFAYRDSDSKRLSRTLSSLSLVNPAVRGAWLSVRERLVEVIGELIELGQASGEFRTDVSKSALAEFLVHIYSSALIRWAETDDDEPLADVMDRVFLLAWDGVRGQP